MAGIRTNRPAGRRRRRRRPAWASLAVWVAALMAAGALPGFGSVSAAVPAPCPGDEPPPCDLSDPEPEPPSDPVGPPWNAKVSVLDQSGVGYDHEIVGVWARNGGGATPQGTVVWSDPAEVAGTITSSDSFLPSGQKGLRLWERSANGLLCRSHPRTSVPTFLQSIHVLLAPPVFTSAETLASIAGEFAGTEISVDAGDDPFIGEVTVTINSVSLVPQDGSLALTVNGHLFIDVQFPHPNVDDDFVYTGDALLFPSDSITDPDEVMAVDVVHDNLTIYGQGEDVEYSVLVGGFRDGVVDRIRDAVNAEVAEQAEVVWFRSLGYTVSFRGVTSSPAGLEVLPSLCKVD